MNQITKKVTQLVREIAAILPRSVNTPKSLVIARTPMLTTALMIVVASVLSVSATLARADIVPPNLEYQESTVDLKVKVMGGYVTVNRTRRDWQWKINSNWEGIKFVLDSIDGSVKTITRSGSEYIKKSTGVYVLDEHNTIIAKDTGYRWQDRRGNWIEYDASGKTTSYGDRNNVKVSLTYDDKNRLIGVFDHFGTQVLWYEYTGDYLTAIRDYTNRRVQYEFTSLPNNARDLTKVIDVLGNPWTYAYDQTSGSTTYESTFGPPAPRGRLLSRTDPEGRTKRIARTGTSVSEKDDDNIGATYTASYDASTKTTYTRVTSPAGKVTEAWTSENGKLIRKDINGKTVQSRDVNASSDRTDVDIDQRGNKTTTITDEWGNTVKTIYPDGASVSYTYEPVFLNVTQEVDERGTVTKYEYDIKGNLTKLTGALGKPEQRITAYTYDQYGNRLTEKRLSDAVTAEALTQYEYHDGKGNVTDVIDAENGRTTSTYFVTGDILNITDPRGKVWQGQRNLKGQWTRRANPNGETAYFEYDRVGNRTKAIDALGSVTTYSYNADNELVTIKDPYGKSATRVLTNRQVVQDTDQEGKVVRYQYTLDDRLAVVIDGNNNEITYNYGTGEEGLSGLLANIGFPTFRQEYKYDARNRVIEASDVLDDNTAYATKTAYDSTGNRIAVTDKEGKTTSYEYDAFSRLKKITDAGNGVTEFFHDSRDNLIALKDQNNHIYRFEYDRRNLRTTEIRPLGQIISYAFDANGNLVDRTDAKFQRHKYIYDDSNRLVTENHYAAGHVVADKSITYSYNAVGTLTGYDDGITRATYGLDVNQRKTSESVNYGNFTLNYSYTYYDNGRKKTFTGPDGVLQTYAYDANNKIASIALPVGSIIYNAYRWLAPNTITLPGGTIKQYTYDPLLRVTSINVRDPAQTQVMGYRYTYDKSDNVLKVETDNGSRDYVYDDLYRLTQANVPTFDLETYLYDPAHNRIGDSKVQGIISYDSNNAITQYGNVAYLYDNNGNMVQKTNGTATTRYLYDVTDRLIQVNDDSTGAVIATYSYDPFGKRLAKTTDGTKTYYFYSDEGLISEHDAVGNITVAYGYLPDSAFTSNPLFQKRVDAANNAENYYFYQNDNLGTPQKLTDVRGAVVWNAAYAAYGLARVDSGATAINNLRFPGQYEDKETSIYYNNKRYYDPQLGRYVQSDPLGIEGGTNLFAYAANNPQRYIDTTGSLPELPTLAYRCAYLRLMVLFYCKPDGNPRCNCETDDCETLLRKTYFHLGCIEYQMRLTEECFPDDPTHTQRLRDELNATKRCVRCIKLKNCMNCPVDNK